MPGSPIRVKWLCLQVQLGLFCLGRYIHLVSAGWVIGFCHGQQTFRNQGGDIHALEVYPVFQIEHIHYFQKTFGLFAEIQNRRSHQVLLDGFS